ncbi:MAG: PD-(D/E)XK nuclease family protein [Nanoarchaeota archaeon]|nr:PD-(D/E)XK nuclease family protein [Nanoarchaeota archaeon]
MYLSNSSLSAFVKCPAYGMYKYILKLTKKTSANPNRDALFGTIVHRALKIYGDTQSPEEAIKSIYSDPEGQFLSAHSKKSLAVADILARKEIRILQGYNIKEVEKDFQFPVGEHFWVGRWDSIIEDKGLVYVIDYKTTGDAEFQLRPNSQILSYYVGASKYFKNLGGVYIHVLRASDCTIQSFYIKPSFSEVEEWKDDTIWQMKQISSYIDLGIFPKNPASCNLYRRPCEYLPLCQSFGKVREVLMQNDYVKQDRRCLNEAE